MRLVLIAATIALVTYWGFWMPGTSAPGTRAVVIEPALDGTSVSIVTDSASDPNLQVTASGLTRPLLGQTERQKDRLRFHPALHFTPGQSYSATWQSASGETQYASFEVAAAAAPRPTVKISPDVALPANALRFYLHFSEPMEQGVFLDKLRLLDSAGREISGPFRETELWSPDGKRLTVWFHPGRQKTGVNLQTDEGPVLTAHSRHSLVVSGDWRSVQGAPIGQEVVFPISTSDADHTCPAISKWELTLPRSQSLDPLLIDFDEPLDPAILPAALSIKLTGQKVHMEVTLLNSGKQWQGKPSQPWHTGDYELHASSILEDLAGNNLLHPFEVDMEAGATQTPPLIRTFTLEPVHEK